MAALEVIALNKTVPQLMAPQVGDTYYMPRDVAVLTTAANANGSAILSGNTISETVSGSQWLVASQFDVGTAPNQIPLNQYLGTMAWQDAAGVNLTGVMALLAGTAALPSLSFSGDSNTGFWSPAADTVAVSTNGVERLRVDSAGNVGVRVTPGTWNSTSRVIQVGVQQAVESFGADQIWWRNIVRTPSGLQYIDNGFAQAFASETDGAFKWYTAANNTSGAGAAATVTQRMTLDAAGNLGLGTTPSTWTVRAIDIGSWAAFSTELSGESILSVNSYYNAGWKYKNSANGAGRYDIVPTSTGAQHVWRVAANGTAGTAITFAQAMTLDASGNLGVGTSTFGTSAVKVLSIGTGTEPSTGPADTVQFFSVDRSAGNTIPGIRCEGTGVTDAGITNTTVTNKIAIKVNGTVYYLLATTNAT